MAEIALKPQGKRRWSSGNLEDFLSFEPTEKPVWMKASISGNTSSIPSISEMIKDITGYTHTYQELKLTNTAGKTSRKKARKSLLIKYLCNVQKDEDIGVKEEGKTAEIIQNLENEYDTDEVGDIGETGCKRKLSDCSTSPSSVKKSCEEDERNSSSEFDTYPSLEEELGEYHESISSSGEIKPSKTETETKNLYKAYKHVVKELKEAKNETGIAPGTSADNENESFPVDSDYKGVIDLDSSIIHTHRILMQNVMKEGQIPGRFSTQLRTATFKGKEYWYSIFKDERCAEEAVLTLVDKVNDIMEAIKHRNVSYEEKIKLYFKCSSLLLFGFLTLHPFSDGNGRLARLLASYNLLTFSPFMTPIYNVFSSSRECDYVQALVDTREGLQLPKNISCKDEAVSLTISVMHRKPCDLCAMLIESNWTMWRQLLVKLGDSTINLFDWEVQNQQFLSKSFEASGSVQ